MKHILVVEDELELQRAMKRALNELPDVHVSATAEVAEARGLIACDRPDLVIADLRLPDGTGVELLGAMEALGLRSPVVFISGHVDVYSQQIPDGPSIEVHRKPIGVKALKRLAVDRLGQPLRPPFSVADFVQAASMGGESIRLTTFVERKPCGEIILVKGRLWSARTAAGATGPQALATLVQLGTTGTTQVVPLRSPPQTKQQFTTNTAAHLLKASGDKKLLELPTVGRRRKTPSPTQMPALPNRPSRMAAARPPAATRPPKVAPSPAAAQAAAAQAKAAQAKAAQAKAAQAKAAQAKAAQAKAAQEAKAAKAAQLKAAQAKAAQEAKAKAAQAKAAQAKAAKAAQAAAKEKAAQAQAEAAQAAPTKADALAATAPPVVVNQPPVAAEGPLPDEAPPVVRSTGQAHAPPVANVQRTTPTPAKVLPLGPRPNLPHSSVAPATVGGQAIAMPGAQDPFAVEHPINTPPPQVTTAPPRVSAPPSEAPPVVAPPQGRRKGGLSGPVIVAAIVGLAAVVVALILRPTDVPVITSPPPAPPVVESGVSPDDLNKLLERASELVDARRYDEAASLLRGIGDDHQGDAQQRIRLNELLSNASLGHKLAASRLALDANEDAKAMALLREVLLRRPSDKEALEQLKVVRQREEVAAAQEAAIVAAEIAAEAEAAKHAPADAPPRPKRVATPKPHKISLSSAPHGLFLIDGTPISYSPLKNHKLGPGPHRIEVRREGYHNLVRRLVVDKSTPSAVSYTLTPRAQPAASAQAAPAKQPPK